MMPRTDTGRELLRNAIDDVYQVGEILRLEDTILHVLTTCRRTDSFNLYAPRENGALDVLEGWRAKHRTLLSKKYRGGQLFHPGASREMIQAKAMLMTWKQALVGPDDYNRVPYGGAKGGVRCNIDSYTPREQEGIIRDLVEQLDPIIAPGWDELGPDLRFKTQHITWFHKFYQEKHQTDGIRTGAIITGKLPQAGGGIWRPPATALMMHYVIQTLRAMRQLPEMPEIPTTITHGSGQVGGWFAKFAREHGLNLIGACDEFGGIVNPHGLDTAVMERYVKETGSLKGIADGDRQISPRGDYVTPEALLSQPCHILALNSMEGVVHEGNADSISTKVIIEGANGPITKNARRILEEKGICIIPGILANAGGVVASFFETLQEIQGEPRTEERVNEDLKKYILGGITRMLKAAATHNLSHSWHYAALTAAIEYVVWCLRNKHPFLKNKPLTALV